MCEKMRAMRARRDSGSDSAGARKGAPLSWQDDPILTIRAANVRGAERDKRRAALKSIQRRQLEYEPWQRGLIQAAVRWREHEERDDIARERRKAERRWRARVDARRRRAGLEPSAAPPLKRGRPSTSSRFLIGAAVSTHENFPSVTYRQIAAFLVESVAPHFLPGHLRVAFLGKRAPRAEQRVRLEARLRRAASPRPGTQVRP